MNKFWIFVSVLVILTVALSACGSGDGSGGGGIQLPGMEGGEEGAAGGNTLIYVLIGAIVLVAVVALVGRK